MSELCKNAIDYLQRRFIGSPVLNNQFTFQDTVAGTEKKVWPMIVQDLNAGVKHRAVAIENLGDCDELRVIAKGIREAFNDLDATLYVEMGKALNKTGHDINTNQMPFSSRLILYTNKLCVPIENVIRDFSDHIVQVVDESDMYKTLFISYGGPDESLVGKLNGLIKLKGVKTWFFKDDALPGQKLHRVMHQGVNEHDRVLLICSESSLTRPGVLNEIERVLEREAKEGGTDILLPVTLDDYIFSDWAPSRPDIASQVRSRVITKLDFDVEPVEMNKQLSKIIAALRK